MVRGNFGVRLFLSRAWRLIKQRIGSYEKIITILDDIKCDGSTIRGADDSTYSEHGRSPSYSGIELGLRTNY